MIPRVLLIDDDALVLDTYADLLAPDRYVIGRARSRDQALRLAEQDGPWDVAIVDERLNGPGGPETASTLIGELYARAPEVLAIVVTGFARPELVRRALEAGAWDYLQKDTIVEYVLPQKVRQAADIAVARRLARDAVADPDGAARDAWAAARAATDTHAKGRLLEDTLRLLFLSLPGLTQVRQNPRSMSEEFDLVVRNESSDPFLSKEGQIWLVECKNWSKPVGRSDYDALEAKLRRRSGRTRLGLCVGVAGFTAGFKLAMAQGARDDHLIVAIDADDLTAWIEAPDRLAWLKERITTAVTQHI